MVYLTIFRGENMNKYTVFICLMILSLACFAAEVIPPMPNTAPVVDIPVSDFLSQVLDAVKGFGGLSWLLKISAVITVILASMKVSFMRDLVWDKLGAAKAWAAPILGLIVGILNLATAGGHITLPAILAYVSAGAGAIILHELLDTLKAVPGIGPKWVEIISVISAFTGGNSKPTA